MRSERGAVTVLAVAVLGLLLLIAGALGVVGAMIADHRRAQAAADLAALAAAHQLGRGGDPCASAAQIAVLNHARLSACAVAGDDVVVTVLVEGPRWLGQAGDLSARARAGPG